MNHSKPSEAGKRIVLASIAVVVATILAEISFYIRSRSEGLEEDYIQHSPREITPMDDPEG